MRAAIRTGEIKTLSKGLVDYIAKGELRSEDTSIPCEIGYIKDKTPDGNKILRAAYVFIKRDGVNNKDGYAYNKETLYNLDYNDIIACDEEA